MKSIKYAIVAILMGSSFVLNGCNTDVQNAVLTGAQGTASALSQALISSVFSQLGAQNAT